MIQTGFFVKTLIATALILTTILTGFLMHRAGKPYNNGLFTLHKLATIGFVVFMIVQLSRYLKNNLPGFVMILLLCIAILSLAGLMISGAFMSLGKLSETMFRVHNAMWILFVASISGIFYKISDM